MSRNKKVDRFLIFSNFTKSNDIEFLLLFSLLQNINILVENALFICIILIILLFLILFSLIIFSSRDLFSLVFMLLQLDRETSLSRKNFKINWQTSKLNILVLDKTFRIIYIYYLFALCKLLKKITNLKILKKSLYKRKREILSSR